jgi:hypothetical protein
MVPPAPVLAVLQLPRDSKDEPYLNLAAATQASFIVTRDRDLLDLMNDEAFRAAYPQLTIVDPGAFSSTFAVRWRRRRAVHRELRSWKESRPPVPAPSEVVGRDGKTHAAQRRVMRTDIFPAQSQPG